MKKTLVFISVLAGMTMVFTGCGANVNLNVASQPAAGNLENAQVTVTVQDNEAAAPAVTEISAPAVSEAVTSVSDTASVPGSAQSSSSENTAVVSEGIVQKISALAADGSPLSKGYEACGYSSMMDRYFNVLYIPNGYKYKMKTNEYGRPGFMLGTAWFYTGAEGTVKSILSEDISADDKSGYERLLAYINSKAGEGNFRIHDAFTETYRDEYGPSFEEGEGIFEGRVLHIETVMNSDYEKYSKAADADKEKFTVKYEIAEDGRIKSEYEYYSEAKELRSQLINELNAFSDKYAYGIDCCGFYDWDTADLFTSVHTPFHNTYKRAYVNGEESTFWLGRKWSNTAVYADAENSPKNIHNDIQMTVYCRPGTDTSNLKSVLEELYPVTSKYDVGYINIDVLKNESDFDNFRNCDGYIPEAATELECREYHFNNPAPEFKWGVPGK